ncbi:MAG: hypothetical protein Q9178_006390 [Gyalolechia marmorata]
MTSFAEATAVKAVNSHTYRGSFLDEWCIGNALHFSTHAACNQLHTITLHLTFLRRTSVGPALFTIRDVKLGRRTSTVHISLTQNNDAEPSIVGYLTQSNLHTEDGISLPTKWSLHPPPLPLLSPTALKHGHDPNWTQQPTSRFSTFRKAAQRIKCYLPRHGQPAPAMADEWICLADGGKFTQHALGFVVDSFPQIVEIYPGTASASTQRMEGEKALIGTRSGDDDGAMTLRWYPTVLLNLEVKKALPEEGVEWLFVRARAKKIQNGRMDLEVVVLDEGGDVVALSNHVCLILSAERNTKRSGQTKI